MQGQLSNLAALAEVTVFAALNYWDMKHAGSAFAVDIPSMVEYIDPPFLISKVGKSPGFHSGIVCNNELLSFFRNKRRPNQFRKYLRHGRVLALHHPL